MEKQLTEIDSKHRVAFDLMLKILQWDQKYNKEGADKIKLLNLYSECLHAVKYDQKPEDTQ